MNSNFDNHFFSQNRQKLKQLFVGTAPIVLTANGLLQRGGDNTFDFTQDANFWYLTGIDEPDTILVMDKDKEYLILPSRSDYQNTFDGDYDLDEISKKSGIKSIYNQNEGWDKLRPRLKKVKHVATLKSPEPYIIEMGFYTNPSRAKLCQEILSNNSQLELLDLSPHLLRMRSVKQKIEIAVIQKSINITTFALKNVIKRNKLTKYKYEYEIEADLNNGFRRQGATGPAFSSIVAAGKKACVLHNKSNNSQILPGDLIIIDCGSQYDHYAADITRTVSQSTPTKRQKEVFEAVKEVQKFALSLLKPGSYLLENEKQINLFMGEKLRSLGLIKTISEEEVKKYYPHSTSHFMGLNVHDVGNYAQALVPGSVLTVEPGIYIKEENLGIRIEDNILITNNGIKILSNNLPSQLF